MSHLTRLSSLVLVASSVACTAVPPSSETLWAQATRPISELRRHHPGPISYYPRQEIAQAEKLLAARNLQHMSIWKGPGPAPSNQPDDGTTSECTIPTTGAQKILVLPVIVDDYATPPSARDSAAELTDFLFGTPVGRQTLTQYFAAASRGAAPPLEVTGDVMEWRSISHANTESSTTHGSELASASDPIVHKALQAFENDVDYGEYDSNADGCIDWLMIVHSGPDQAVTRNEKDIWSHFEFYLPQDRQLYDGMSAWGAIVISAWSPIGMYAHEFGHALGLPDLYSFGPPNRSIIGFWSLMDYGSWSGPDGHKGEKPTGLDPYSLQLLEWVAPELVSSPVSDKDLLISTTTPSTVLRIDLPALGDPPEANQHYLLVEARRNNAACSSGVSFIDDCLSASGVLIWEIDEGGANAFGELRQRVTVADAYPNEGVKGVAPEALLADAPFNPPNDPSRFEARGVRLDVKAAVTDGYRTDIQIDGAAKAELKAKWIRVTSDPHATDQPFTVQVEVTNVGSAAAHGVQVTVGQFPGAPWSQPLTQTVGSGTLAEGASATVAWSTTPLQAGHVDLYAKIEGDDAAEIILRDKGYVGTRISEFEIATQTNMGEEANRILPDAWDFELADCAISVDVWYFLNQGRARHLATNGMDPALVPMVRQHCDDHPGDEECSECVILDRHRPATGEHPAVDPAAQRYCWVSGANRSCRGTITNLWVGDFLGDAGNEILVRSCDNSEYDRQFVHCVNTPAAPDCQYDHGRINANGVGWCQLTMFRYNAGQQALDRIWEINPAKLRDDTPPAGVQYVQPWACHQCMGFNARVFDLGDGRNSLLFDGMAGSESYILRSQPGDTLFLKHQYSSGEFPFEAANLMAWGANLDGLGLDGGGAAGNFIAGVTYSFPEYTPRVFRLDLGGAKPEFIAGDYVAYSDHPSLFLAAYQAEYSEAGGDHDQLKERSRAKAFMDDVNGDGKTDLVYADGNGMNTGRVMVFDQPGVDQRLAMVRKDWGNGPSALMARDWDGDGVQEIVVTSTSDNSLNVFKHVSATGRYELIFSDSFGGYTGSGYNPAVAVGDVDGNGTREVILGEGGHCSVPTVGSGVYVYGFGMVMRDDDRDGDGERDDDAGLGIFVVATGDLDGVPGDEIVAGSESGDLYVLRYQQKDSSTPTATEEVQP